ncbi:STAS/SEC14 domain-containing protein [Mycobacterium seoulense]|uniref:STAS/SEC14 domain-containing protein n=1 Tax=Mycobacterium seoulense TaxID=386911 RepID=UPI003CF731FA
MPAGIQALEADGTVTAADYERVFAPLVGRARRTGTRLRLLYVFGPGFQRITPGALWADMRLGWDYVRLLDGCAVVTDIGWVRAPSRAIGKWMPVPVRLYANAERDDAVAWLTLLPAATEVSALDMAEAFFGGTGAALLSLGRLVVSTRVKSRRHGVREKRYAPTVFGRGPGRRSTAQSPPPRTAG